LKKPRDSKKNRAKISLEKRRDATEKIGDSFQQKLFNLKNESIETGMSLFVETLRQKDFNLSKDGQWKQQLQDRSAERKGNKLSSQEELSFLQLLIKKSVEKSCSEQEQKALEEYIRLSGIVSSLETTQTVLQQKLKALTSHPVSDAKAMLRIRRNKKFGFTTESADLEEEAEVEEAEVEDYLEEYPDDSSDDFDFFQDSLGLGRMSSDWDDYYW